MDLELLKQRKKDPRLTNQQLAELSGVSSGTINKIFSRATKSPQMATINALLSVLKLDTYEHSKPLDSWMVHNPSATYQLELEQKLYTTEDTSIILSSFFSIRFPVYGNIGTSIQKKRRFSFTSSPLKTVRNIPLTIVYQWKFMKILPLTLRKFITR